MSDLTSVLTIENNKLVARSDVSIYGVLNVAKIQTNELVANQRYESQFIEFSPDNEQGSNVGSGFLWPMSGGPNKQFVLRDNPDRFWSTESIDIEADKAYHIGGSPVISATGLGGSILESNLQSVGILESLTVGGHVNIDGTFFFNPETKRVGINTEEPSATLSIYDPTSDVEIVVYTDVNGRARIGTHHARGMDIITDEQARISVESNGDVQIGHEWKDSTQTRVYGKLSVGVKSPREQLEVAGNIRFANKLFATGDSAPTEGSYTIGDVVWNVEPKSDSYIGWVCTQTGSPGTWKPFGLIGS